MPLPLWQAPALPYNLLQLLQAGCGCLLHVFLCQLPPVNGYQPVKLKLVQHVSLAPCSPFAICMLFEYLFKRLYKSVHVLVTFIVFQN